MNNNTQPYTIFNHGNHLKPEFSKEQFEQLHGWDFGWELLDPINIAADEHDELELATRLSPVQKTLYFFWYLDAAVTNGGFVQFYCNGYRKYLPAIDAGLRLIGDNEMLALLEKAEQQYHVDQKVFEDFWANPHLPPPYKKLTHFEELDEQYYCIHDNTMLLIEKYVRENPDEFVQLG